MFYGGLGLVLLGGGQCESRQSKSRDQNGPGFLAFLLNRAAYRRRREQHRQRPDRCRRESDELANRHSHGVRRWEGIGQRPTSDKNGLVRLGGRQIKQRTNKKRAREVGKTEGGQGFCMGSRFVRLTSGTIEHTPALTRNGCCSRCSRLKIYW